MSPFRCPSLFSILSFIEYKHGVFHPVGGCSAVTAAMARVAERLGVEIRLDQPVGGDNFSRPASGWRSDAGRHQAGRGHRDQRRLCSRHVALGPRSIAASLDRSQDRAEEVLVLDLHDVSRRGRQVGLPHHSIYIARDYARNLDEIENQHVLSSDPSFYVQNACMTDPSLAPSGMSTLYVLAPVTHQHPNVDWSRERGASALDAGAD